jgi:hypothetical protein
VVGVPPLSTEDALSSGVTIGSEFLVFCVAGGILIYEYNVSEKSNAAKAAVAAKEREEARQRLEDRLCAIDTQLLVLADRLQAVEKSQGELQASSQVGFACTISYERECALVFMKGIVVCFCRAALYHTAGYLACLGQIQLGPVVGHTEVDPAVTQSAKKRKTYPALWRRAMLWRTNRLYKQPRVQVKPTRPQRIHQTTVL